MEENFDALEVIARTRGKVDMDENPSGHYLFPLWGWLTAFFYLLEFVLLRLHHAEWCLWMWVGIPLIGMPVMTYILKKDHRESHIRTRGSKLVLTYWMFAACVIGIGGFIFGFAGLYTMVENPLICLLVGIGAFITGEERRYLPMIAGGLAAASIGILSFLLQGDLWEWQTLCVVLAALSALVIPGHLYEKSVNNGI